MAGPWNGIHVAWNVPGSPWITPCVTDAHRRIPGQGQGTYPLDSFRMEVAFKVGKTIQSHTCSYKLQQVGLPGNGKPRDHFQEDVHNGGAHYNIRKTRSD